MGLVGLTRSWAIELAPYSIRVNSIHPTGVNTPMNDGLAALEGLDPKEIAERSAGNLLPVPWIEPEDVAHARGLSASDRARYVTGAPFLIDAGLTQPIGPPRHDPTPPGGCGASSHLRTKERSASARSSCPPQPPAWVGTRQKWTLRNARQ